MKKNFYLLTLLLLSINLVSCDDFDLDFTTPNHFNLDASAHTIEVKTKQEDSGISAITLNGVYFDLHTPTLEESNRWGEYEGFRVWFRRGVPMEIEGEWFTVEISHRHVFTITLLENSDMDNRSIELELCWRTAYNTVFISQEGITDK